MQNLSRASKVMFDEFSQTERDHRNKEAELQREIKSLESLRNNLRSTAKSLSKEVASAELMVEELETELADLERTHEQQRDALRDADEIIEEAGDQVLYTIQWLYGMRSEMNEEVYTNLMNMLRSSQSVLLRR